MTIGKSGTRGSGGLDERMCACGIAVTDVRGGCHTDDLGLSDGDVDRGDPSGIPDNEHRGIP